MQPILQARPILAIEGAEDLICNLKSCGNSIKIGRADLLIILDMFRAGTQAPATYENFFASLLSVQNPVSSVGRTRSVCPRPGSAAGRLLGVAVGRQAVRPARAAGCRGIQRRPRKT